MKNLIVETMISLGQYPELPHMATNEDFAVSTKSTDHEAGCTLSVHIAGTWPLRMIEDARPFDSRNQAKAYALTMGYLVPWRYLGKALHPLAKDFS